ncbi:MAG TPA: Fur family transcriptional regulator [Gaiellaceae bacterium]|nr:Fur family transcriptional regulator [Gaiellaceae bacterium]
MAEPRQPDFHGLLSQHGLRSTPQRVAVLGALASRDDATAQQIHAILVDHGLRVGLATVYRTLARLRERGVVDTLSHHPGEACYRLCGEGHHHHLVCSDCHRVVEIGDCELDPWLADLASEHGFTVSAHTVEVTGICADCRTSTAAR